MKVSHSAYYIPLIIREERNVTSRTIYLLRRLEQSRRKRLPTFYNAASSVIVKCWLVFSADFFFLFPAQKQLAPYFILHTPYSLLLLSFSSTFTSNFSKRYKGCSPPSGPPPRGITRGHSRVEFFSGVSWPSARRLLIQFAVDSDFYN